MFCFRMFSEKIDDDLYLADAMVSRETKEIQKLSKEDFY